MNRDRPFYYEFAWAYDLLLAEPVDARVEFISTTLSRNGVESRSALLDAGCGTGRYAAELAKRGFRVCAVDRSPELIAAARMRENSCSGFPQFVIADLVDLSFSRPFEAVLCRGVLNDLVADGARAAVFRQFANWLSPRGILIFDVREWTETASRYRKNPFYRRRVELPDGFLQFQSETLLDDKSRRLLIRERFDIDRGGRCTRTDNDFTMRAWTLEEIAAHLGGAGLEEIATYRSYGDGAWSDRIVVIARNRPVE